MVCFCLFAVGVVVLGGWFCYLPMGVFFFLLKENQSKKTVNSGGGGGGGGLLLVAHLLHSPWSSQQE